jgi:hypothetical protein
MKTSMKWVNGVADFCVPKQKDGESNEDYQIRANKTKYIKFNKDVALLKGQILSMQKFEDNIKSLHEKGFIKDEDLEKRLSFGKFVKYVISAKPATKEVEVSPNEGWLNNAIELRRGNDGSFYLVAKEDLAMSKGATINLKKASDNIQEMFEKGIINEEQREHRLNAIKAKDENGNLTNNFWLIYVGSVPPTEK